MMGAKLGMGAGTLLLHDAANARHGASRSCGARGAYPDEDPLPLQVDIGDGELARQRHFGGSLTEDVMLKQLDYPARQLCWGRRRQVHAAPVSAFGGGTLRVICNEGLRGLLRWGWALFFFFCS